MVDELCRHIVVARIERRQLDTDLEHVLAEQGHPCRTVGLFEVAAARQLRAAVENADIIQPEKSALENVPVEPVFAVDPPGEVQHQLSKGPAQKIHITSA